MDTIRKFTGDTEAELWQQVVADMALQEEILQYSAQLNQAGQTVYFDIDIDLGGGFEGGYASTTFMTPVADFAGPVDNSMLYNMGHASTAFSAPVHSTSAFRFHLHEEGFLDEIGKVFGMEDVQVGYPEIDKAFIVKTNQPEKLKALLADEGLQAFLLKHKDCQLELKREEEEQEAILTFSADRAILDVAELQEVYHWMRQIAQRVAV